MGLLTWLVLGLVVGVLAHTILPGRAPGGLLRTIILGLVGAFAGGFIGSRLGFGTVTGINLRSLLIALGGALLALFAYGALRARKG